MFTTPFYLAAPLPIYQSTQYSNIPVESIYQSGSFIYNTSTFMYQHKNEDQHYLKRWYLPRNSNQKIEIVGPVKVQNIFHVFNIRVAAPQLRWSPFLMWVPVTLPQNRFRDQQSCHFFEISCEQYVNYYTHQGYRNKIRK